MKMFKRLAAFAIVLSMVLAMLPATVSAAELPADVKETKYEDAASLLCALEIMVGDGEKFNPDNNVTRAEFAKILVTTMGHLETAASFTAQGKFEDVAASEWYAPFVEFAAQLGAINGYGDGKFGPNDNVTGYQAIKMICFASGHNACINDPVAGYPQEYFTVAKDYGFLKGLNDVNFSMPMTRGQVAILAANVLKVDMLKLTGSSDTSNRYVAMKDVSLLTSKHNVYKFEGLVTTNEKTGIFGPSNLSAGQVRLEKDAKVVLLLAGESGIEENLGVYGTAYYKDDDNAGTQTVLCFDESSVKNDKIKVAQEFIDLDDSTDTAIKYWADEDKDSRTKKLEVVKNVPIIWNGAASSYTSLVTALTDADGMQAQVEFLDYDGDNRIDIASIMAYDTYVIDRIDADKYIITDKVGKWSTGKKQTKKLTLDMEDDTCVISISDIDGEEYTFEDLAVGDVLSVARSEDGKVVDVKVSTDTLEGVIGSIGMDNSRLIFEIDGEDYNLSKSYTEYIKGGDADASVSDLSVRIGKSYEFKLDAFGQLAYSETVKGDARGEFGFITFYAPGEGADSGINVRMYSAGTVGIYGIASTVLIDGQKYKGEAEVKGAMDAIVGAYIPKSKVKATNGYYGDGAWNGIPVLFELDGENKIKYIDTPTKGAEEDEYTLQPTKGQAGEIISSGYSSSSFGSSRPVASTANVIQLPGKDTELSMAEKYSTAKNFNSSTTYYVQLFSTDPDTYSSNFVIIAKGAAGSKDATFTTDIAKGLDDAETVNGGNSGAGVKTTPLFVVKSISRGVAGEDGDEETIRITGFENGAEVTYTVDPEYYATGYIYQTMEKYYKEINPEGSLSGKRTNTTPIMEGDVLRLARNKTSKYVTFVAPVFYMEEKALFAQMNNGYLNNNDVIYCAIDIATVKEMDGNQGVLSYLIKNYTNNTKYSGMFSFDNGRLVPPAEKEGYVEGTNDITDVKWVEANAEEGIEAHFEGDFTKMHNIGGFTKITTYDASEPAGRRVSKGSLSDIITLEDASEKTNPSIILMHYRTQTDANYSMVILNF